MTQSPTHRVASPSGCVGAVTGLVLRCGEGDRAALCLLLDLFYGAVRGKVAPQGRARAGGDADAHVVEVFDEVWRRSSRFQVGQDPVAWVLTVADEVGGLLDRRPAAANRV